MAAPTLPLLAPVNWLVDQVAARVTGRPASIRWDAAPLDALRGRARLLTIGVEDLRVAGLTINKGVVRIVDARIDPGLEPRLTGRPGDGQAHRRTGSHRRVGRTGQPAVPPRADRRGHRLQRRCRLVAHGQGADRAGRSGGRHPAPPPGQGRRPHAAQRARRRPHRQPAPAPPPGRSPAGRDRARPRPPRRSPSPSRTSTRPSTWARPTASGPASRPSSKAAVPEAGQSSGKYPGTSWWGVSR